MELTDIISIAGYLYLASIAVTFLKFIWVLLRGYVLTSFGFVADLTKYGKWAVVTGASDGIGKEYARQLAKRGFNIVLISRTLSKLEAVAQTIQNECGVETKVITQDYSKSDHEGYDKIADELSPLDIGILVNNVGMVEKRVVPFFERSTETLFDMMHTNTFPTVRMTHMVLKGMVKRNRGVVVHISAGAVYIDNFPMPVYAATKSFVNKLIRALQYEYPGVIRHQTVVPFGVATKIVGEGKLSSGLTVLSAEDYAMKAVRTISVLDYTHGCVAHEIMGFLLQILPQWFVSATFPLAFRKEMKKMEEKTS